MVIYGSTAVASEKFILINALTIRLYLNFTVNIMARNEMWIIADNDSADKMVKFHQIKNLAASDARIQKWYIFCAFDTYTQTAKDIGNVFQQLERGLLKTMTERPRAPHSIIFLLGDALLDDKKLGYNSKNLRDVLMQMCKQLKRTTMTYVDMLPAKAQPLSEIKLFITKPLPKPEALLKHKGQVHRLAKQRHCYNNQLIPVLKELGISFLNPGIAASDTRAFQAVKDKNGRDKFLLSPQGLHQFWDSISTSIQKLHIGRAGQNPSSIIKGHKPATTKFTRYSNNTSETPSSSDRDIEEYFTLRGNTSPTKYH